MTARETEILVIGLESRPFLVSGKLGGAHKTTDDVTNAWKEIGLEMESEGFDCKDPKVLVKKWTDLKYRVRRKARMIKLNRLRTGGGEAANIYLNPIEERVLNLAGPSTTKGCEDDDIDSPPNPVFTLGKAGPSTPPVVNQRISRYQVTPSTITPLMPRVSPLASLNHYTEQVESSEEAVMHPTASETSMDISNSENVEISVEGQKYKNAYQTPRVKTFKRRKRLQAKTNFNKLLDVELRRLTLEEKKVELRKKQIEMEEKKLQVLQEQLQLTKENIAISRQQLVMSSEILTVLQDISKSGVLKLFQLRHP